MEAVVSRLPLDKASNFFFKYEKHPQSLLYNIAASLWGLLMFFTPQVLAFLPPSNLLLKQVIASESLQVCENMVRAWVQHHTVFKEVPQKHNDTLTNMGLSALWLRPKHYFFFLCSCSFSLILMAVSRKLWREVLYLFYWSTFTLSNLSAIHLPEIPNRNHLILQSKHRALHGHPPSIHARHDKACPCDNPLLTLLC